MAANLDTLPFLEDELSNVLIDEFSLFYIVRICLFKNSTHILDIEETIAARLNAETFVDGADPLHNFRFVDSKLEWARTFGATHAFNAKDDDLARKIRDVVGPQGADVVVDTTGS